MWLAWKHLVYGGWLRLNGNAFGGGSLVLVWLQKYGSCHRGVDVSFLVVDPDSGQVRQFDEELWLRVGRR
jgi:hypothetical protein